MGYISLWGSDFAASKGCSMYKAKSELDKAQLKLDNYKPTLNTTVHDLLVETLNLEPNIDTLKSLMTDE